MANADDELAIEHAVDELRERGEAQLYNHNVYVCNLNGQLDVCIGGLRAPRNAKGARELRQILSSEDLEQGLENRTRRLQDQDPTQEIEMRLSFGEDVRPSEQEIISDTYYGAMQGLEDTFQLFVEDVEFVGRDVLFDQDEFERGVQEIFELASQRGLLFSSLFEVAEGESCGKINDEQEKGRCISLQQGRRFAAALLHQSTHARLLQCGLEMGDNGVKPLYDSDGVNPQTISEDAALIARLPRGLCIVAGDDLENALSVRATSLFDEGYLQYSPPGQTYPVSTRLGYMLMETGYTEAATELAEIRENLDQENVPEYISKPDLVAMLAEKYNIESSDARIPVDLINGKNPRWYERLRDEGILKRKYRGKTTLTEFGERYMDSLSVEHLELTQELYRANLSTKLVNLIGTQYFPDSQRKQMQVFDYMEDFGKAYIDYLQSKEMLAEEEIDPDPVLPFEFDTPIQPKRSIVKGLDDEIIGIISAARDSNVPLEDLPTVVELITSMGRMMEIEGALEETEAVNDPQIQMLATKVMGQMQNMSPTTREFVEENFF